MISVNSQCIYDCFIKLYEQIASIRTFTYCIRHIFYTKHAIRIKRSVYASGNMRRPLI